MPACHHPDGHEAGEVLYRCGDNHFPVSIASCLCPESLQHQAQYLRDHGHLLARPIIREGADGLYVVDGAYRLRAAFDAGSDFYESFCGSEACQEQAGEPDGT